MCGCFTFRLTWPELVRLYRAPITLFFAATGGVDSDRQRRARGRCEAHRGRLVSKAREGRPSTSIQNGPGRARRIKGLQWQTYVRGNIERQRIFPPVANLATAPMPFLDRRQVDG